MIPVGNWEREISVLFLVLRNIRADDSLVRTREVDVSLDRRKMVKSVNVVA